MRLFATAIALAGLFAMASPAQASLVLALDSGANSSTTGWDVVVVDQSGAATLSSGGIWTSTVADGSGATPGLISFSGSVGGFFITFQVGTSAPLIGPRRLDILSMEISGTVGGTLSILLIDTDYVAPLHPGPYGVNTLIGGTTDGTVFTRTGVSTTNSEDLSFFSGPFNVSTFSPGAFSSDTSGLISMAPGSSFSIYSLIHVTHAGSPPGAGAITSFDQLVTVPEPASALLLALGFAGVVAGRRRRRQT